MDHVPPQHQHDADGSGGDGRTALSRRVLRALFVALALIAAAGFAALGVWQVERRAWKLDLIERVDARVHAAPTPLPAFGRDPRGDEYRRVRATGTFDHDRETLTQAVTERGAGFWVLTPLRTAGGTVLVNRGFVPSDRRSPQSRAAGQASGPVTVTGLLRVSEPGGGFLRANDPAADRWHSRDIAAIAQAKGLESTSIRSNQASSPAKAGAQSPGCVACDSGPLLSQGNDSAEVRPAPGPVAPYFVDADATPNPGGYPIGGLTVIAFRNNHLVYALTWFGLALLSLSGAVLLLRMRARG